jgi:hypothetical protein
MLVCGQYFNSEMIRRIQATVEADSTISRRALSRLVCEWLDWRGANGKLQDMSCRKALLKLQRQGLIILPDSQKGYSFQKTSGRGFGELPDIAEVNCTLSELGEVDVVPVSSRYSKRSRIWNALMTEFHYLGSGPLCGAQIRYLIWSSAYGWLGGLAFSGATWRLKARDEWIGWSEAARWANLHQVVLNSRFLILPTVRVPNLASHVFALCSARLSEDWMDRYGYKPVLLETFVDPERFYGTCYRASNWIWLGKTAGRKEPYPNGKVPGGKKDIYVYPLCSNWQSILCTEPVTALGSNPRQVNPSDWAEEEFGTVDLYDDRLKNRLFMLANDFFDQPGVLVPQACNGSQAKSKAAYRFFDNKRIDIKTLLKPHVEASLQRIKAHGVVLAVQDTTTLNYTAHPATDGLGPINTKGDNAVGLILHDTMAFTTEGTPLGLLDVQCWARDPEEAGKKERRHDLPIEEKESIKWLNSYRSVAALQDLCSETMLVSVGDREADIYELFYEAQQNPSGPKLLIRAERTRNRKVDQVHLWDKLPKEPLAGFQEVYVPSKGSRPARRAKLAVHFARVKLNPPKRKQLPPVTVWAVYAREIDYSPEVKSPIEWMLLTTVEVGRFEEAAERLAWYARRWGIEVYHRTLKSGCRIEDRRLNNADRIEACLAIDLVVAWRIYWLTKKGRETPDIACDIFLSEDEWKALYAYVRKESPPDKPPSLREAVRMIASLGGFLGRKSDGEPGTTTMWRGLQRLQDIAMGFTMFKSLPNARASP